MIRWMDKRETAQSVNKGSQIRLSEIKDVGLPEQLRNVPGNSHFIMST